MTKSVLMSSADKIKMNISVVEEEGSFIEQKQGMMNIPTDDSEDDYKPKNKTKIQDANRMSGKFGS